VKAIVATPVSKISKSLIYWRASEGEDAYWQITAHLKGRDRTVSRRW
jgi:hypothetical protein